MDRLNELMFKGRALSTYTCKDLRKEIRSKSKSNIYNFSKEQLMLRLSEILDLGKEEQNNNNNNNNTTTATPPPPQPQSTTQKQQQQQEKPITLPQPQLVKPPPQKQQPSVKISALKKQPAQQTAKQQPQEKQKQQQKIDSPKLPQEEQIELPQTPPSQPQTPPPPQQQEKPVEKQTKPVEKSQTKLVEKLQTPSPPPPQEKQKEQKIESPKPPQQQQPLQIQQLSTSPEQQQTPVIQSNNNNNNINTNNKRSHDNDIEETTPNKRIATTTASTTLVIENDRLQQIEDKFTTLYGQIQKLEQTINQKNLELLNNINNNNIQQTQQQHQQQQPQPQLTQPTQPTQQEQEQQEQPKQQSNKLIINNQNNNSEFANQLYNKINNEFNFYRINSQIKKFDEDGIEIRVLRIQEEFVKFIILKIMANDIDINKPSKLIPSPIVYDYWQTMVLNIEKYNEFIKFLGVNILYNLQDKLDMEDNDNNDKKQEFRLKYIKARELYEKYFPKSLTTIQYNNIIWTNNHLLSNTTTTTTTTNSPTTTPTKFKITNSPTTSTTTLSDSINIRVKDQKGGGENLNFKIKRSTRMEVLVDTYCKRKAINRENCYFLFDGSRVRLNDTPSTLEMKDEEIIECILIK